MTLTGKFLFHPALASAFDTLTNGYNAADSPTKADGMNDLVDTLNDLGSHLLTCKLLTPDGLDDRIKTIRSVSWGAEPYLIYEDEEEFGIIVTCHPALIVQAMGDNSLFKIGSLTPEELEAYQVHHL